MIFRFPVRVSICLLGDWVGVGETLVNIKKNLLKKFKTVKKLFLNISGTEKKSERFEEYFR